MALVSDKLCQLLNLSAYKALHPTWNQEPDLLHLAEGLEEHCQEGTLEHWALGKALEASEAQDHTPDTWARIAKSASRPQVVLAWSFELSLEQHFSSSHQTARG